MGSQAGTCLSWESPLCLPASRTEQVRVKESSHGSNKNKNNDDDDGSADVDGALTMHQLLYKVLIYIHYLIHRS